MQIHAKPVCGDLPTVMTLWSGRRCKCVRERVRDRVCFRHDVVIASTLAAAVSNNCYYQMRILLACEGGLGSTASHVP